MKTKRLYLYKTIAANVLLCAVILYFFGLNSRLRPVAFPALYKEYLAGLLALAAIYFNDRLLFPKYYLNRKFKAYWFFTLCTVILSACLEMLLVSPELLNLYSKQGNKEFVVREFMFMDTLYVIIRNGGLILFSYTLNVIRMLKKQGMEKDCFLREKYDSLDVRDENNQTKYIHAHNIYYCEQHRNNSIIYMLDGKQFVRYCSLNSLEDLLGSEEFVRISRNVIVSKNKIVKFKDKQIEMKINIHECEPLVFNVGNAYLENIVNKLNFKIISTSPEGQRIAKPSPAINITPDISNLLNEFKDNPKLLIVHKYISMHPNCKIKDISKACKISKGSVSRYLAKLTEHGLISYNGAKKTGGYTIIQQKSLTEE